MHDIGLDLNIPHNSSFGKYLGLPVKDGCLKSQDFTFILDKVQNKLAGWKANLRSLSGIKSIILFAPILNYYDKCTKIPINICDKIHMEDCNFFFFFFLGGGEGGEVCVRV